MVFKCRSSCDLVVTSCLHTSHLKGFSPVCVRRWFCILYRDRKVLSQKSHGKTFVKTPVCSSICLSKQLFRLYVLPHSVHWTFFSPVWLSLWVFRLYLFLNLKQNIVGFSVMGGSFDWFILLIVYWQLFLRFGANVTLEWSIIQMDYWMRLQWALLKEILTA